MQNTNNAIVLNAEQKMQYNLSFVEQYAKKVTTKRQEIAGQFIGQAARYSVLDVKDPDWIQLWGSWKPNRSCGQLLDSLEYWDKALQFLASKQEEIKLAIQAKTDTVDPVKIAQECVASEAC